MGLVRVLWSLGWASFSEPCSHSGRSWTEGATAGVGFPSQAKQIVAMFSESFPKILEVDPSWREWRWSQQPGFSPRGMLIKAGFFLGERSLPLFPSLAELRKKRFPFFWCWLTQNCLHFKNKLMFVSIVFAVWNPLLNSVKRKWDHWHPPSYFSFFTEDSFALSCILKVLHRPTWQLLCTWRQNAAIMSEGSFLMPQPAGSAIY